jgi:tetratricopeptide (TPR) repeat protein
MGRLLLLRGLTAAGVVGGLGALAWWGLVGSARVAALPPPPVDEGQEAALHAAYLEALVHRRPEHWQARVNLGASYLQADRAADALEQLRAAQRTRPADPGVLRGLAGAAEAAGSLEDQARAWEALARVEPADPEPRIRLAGLYQRLGWLAPARTLARQGLELAPHSPEALRIQAVLDFIAQDYRAAIAAAHRLLREDPGSAVAHSILSACYRLQGRWEASLAEGEAALRSSPETVQYYVDLARLYLDRPQGADLDRAARVLSAAPATDPADARLRRYWLGITRWRMGELAAAQSDLTAVHSEDPAFEEVAFYLSRISRQRGDGERGRAYAREYQQLLARRMALREAEAALRSHLGEADYHLRVARAALALGDPGRARLEAGEALRLDPRNRPALTLRREVAQRERGAG